MAADILKGLEDEAFAAERMGYDKGATVFRAAIAELTELREACKGRTVNVDALESALNTLRGMALLHRDRDFMLKTIDNIDAILTARPVSCEACNAAAAMVDAAREQLRVERELHASTMRILESMADRSRRATDENGGLGA